jgi:large conductance mechanosensitive channel
LPKIVDSLVKDIIMPIVGLIVGPQGFKNSYIPLSEDVKVARAANPNLSLEEARNIGNVLAWGNFITILFDFLILALIVFMLVKAMNRLRRNRVTTTVITQ